MNPFISFCLYVAARIYVQKYKKRPEDRQIHSSLEFILNAMQAIRKKNPLTESFLAQLMVDLGGTSLDTPVNNLRFSLSSKIQCVSRLLVLNPIKDDMLTLYRIRTSGILNVILLFFPTKVHKVKTTFLRVPVYRVILNFMTLVRKWERGTQLSIACQLLVFQVGNNELPNKAIVLIILPKPKCKVSS